jgi:hypothetical protein
MMPLLRPANIVLWPDSGKLASVESLIVYSSLHICQRAQYGSGQYGPPALSGQYSPHPPYGLPYPPRTRREPLRNASEAEASVAGPSGAGPSQSELSRAQQESQTHSRGISDMSFATFGMARSSFDSSHNSHYYDATSNNSGSQSSHHGRHI